MTLEGLTVRSVAEDESLVDEIEDLVELVWPTFIREGSHNPAARYHGDYQGLYDRWPQNQVALLDEAGAVVAAVHCCPLAWDGDENDLPEDGWDWELQSAAEDLAAGRTPRTLGAVSITVHPALRGRHLSSDLLHLMKSLGKRDGLKRLIAPVRPNQKALYPFESMDSYLQRTTPEGLSVDAWIRTHQRIGGRVIRPCSHSMQLCGTVDEWRRWTREPLDSSGLHAIPGGLVLVEVDLAANHVTYTEPNVWIVHEIE